MRDLSPPPRAPAGGKSLAFVMNSPLGDLEIGIEEGALATLRYLGIPASPASPASSEWYVQTSGNRAGALERKIASQLHRYFSDPRWRFALPVAVCGTPFQQRVWQLLERIPPGETMSYGGIARQLGSGARAVGGACRRNPLPIIIPCHRAVTVGGVGGYCGNMKGGMLRAKQWLLQHEAGAD